VSSHKGLVFDENFVYCEFWKLEKVKKRVRESSSNGLTKNLAQSKIFFLVGTPCTSVREKNSFGKYTKKGGGAVSH
jgi:hypothetical protein